MVGDVELPDGAARAAPGAQDPAPEATSATADRFPIVGVGASAGGLEALGALTGSVKPDRIAFVVVQHLAPDHDSLLAELLGRSSKIAVLTARDGMTIAPGHLYVAPPNAELALLHGVLQ